MNEKIDTKRNLCESCTNSFPTCRGEKITFGDGVGNDNVCECGDYNQAEETK